MIRKICYRTGQTAGYNFNTMFENGTRSAVCKVSLYREALIRTYGPTKCHKLPACDPCEEVHTFYILALLVLAWVVYMWK